MKNATKHLLIFDMDLTILSENTDVVIYKLFKNQETGNKIKAKESSMYHGDYMQEVYFAMKEEGITLEDIKNVIINMQLNQGFSEIFDFIKTNKEKFDCILVSGSNTIYVEWILETFQLKDIFKKYYTNPAFPCDEKLILSRNYQSHACKICDGSMCKKNIVEEYLKEAVTEYERKFYMGDGLNDFCPGTFLLSQDTLFPRINFPLWDKIFNKNKKDELKCKIEPWETGKEILNILKLYI